MRSFFKNTHFTVISIFKIIFNYERGRELNYEEKSHFTTEIIGEINKLKGNVKTFKILTNLIIKKSNPS